MLAEDIQDVLAADPQAEFAVKQTPGTLEDFVRVRPSSDLIYGFVYESNYEDEDDLAERFDDLEDAWQEQVYTAAGIPDCPPWGKVNDPAVAATWHNQRDAALRAAGQIVRWGAKFDGDPGWAFGFVLVSGDWDRAEEVIDLTIPYEAEAKLRRLAEFFGVEPKPAKMLLLSSYG